MKPTTEQLEAYKAMTKDSDCPSMEAQIRENLERTCDKFAGNEDKFERCIEYLTECAREILNSNNGDVPDEVCYRICRDYFNDEIWMKEDAEKAERDAKAKERAEKAETKKKAAEAKKKAAEEKKAAAEARKAEIARKKAEVLAKKKAEEEAKKAEIERMKAEAAREAEAMKAKSEKPESGQLDLFAMMGV